MDKQQLLGHLQNDVYCRIQPSAVHGVGVFAIKPIPQGTSIYKGSHEYENVMLNQAEVDALHPQVKRLIYDFFATEADKKKGIYTVPNIGINGMDISFYMNHSHKPNAQINKSGEFIALRDIEEGEELIIDYAQLDEV